MSFEFEGKKYWLKQPEQLSGIWHILKLHPHKTFERELDTLQYFDKIQAPVPKLALFGANFLVLEDTGQTADSWVEDINTADSLKKLFFPIVLMP